MLDAVWLIPAFPLAGFAVFVLLGRKLGEPLAGWLATGAMAGSFVSTVIVFFGLTDRPSDDRFFTQTLFKWFGSGSFTVDVGFLVDPLAITMCLFITGVGTLIHLYSIGYMHGDPNFSKFFVYLNLFAFSMLILVLGDNMLLTFLGWEGVGACSYLLISFWFDSEANASAGKKAFVTNRIGDFGFMIAIFLTFETLGSVTYLDVFEKVEGQFLSPTTASAIAALFFLGAVGKSAQFPLYLWLPDAMAGPTPVSALIHAATMVTSGVYLMTRLNPILFEANDWVPNLIAWVGAGTALFAATIAIGQNDIKKVLAYSTVSQLGYMFLAVGTGAYVAAIFHMVMHAFFKALLFLGSGSVIHGMNGDQDMRHYGRLAKFIPITASTFIVGWLAIAGVPPFAGFWSKDEILAHAWDHNKGLWVVGIVTALLTAFYMSRLVFMTFFGSRTRYSDPTKEEILAAWRQKVATAQEFAHSRVMAATNAEEAVAAARTKLATATDDTRAAIDAEFDTAQRALFDARAAADEATLSATELAGRVSQLRIPDAAFDREPDVEGIADLLPTADIAARKAFHPHESSWLMWLPLVVLAGLSVVGGIVNLPFTHSLKRLEIWLEPSLFEHEAHLNVDGAGLWVLAIVAVATSALGIAGAYLVYIRRRVDPARVELPVFANGWYFDETVSAFVGGRGEAGFETAARFDRKVIDGIVNGVGIGIRTAASYGRRMQTGFVRSYALFVGVGAALLLVLFLTRAAL
ncbi:MAG TPA: NADH-quinone oxidoreductase subunit L [Acidimicrobiales bacterium]|nr:NADH-quinone oxidoreductase subunit L [Acidimicrobiales bacterium]